MNSIPENYIEEKQFDDRINLFFRKFKIYQALQHANAYKKRGVPVIQILLYLFQLVFTNRSMYMNLIKNKDSNRDKNVDFKKDTVYRFLNSIYINWQTFVMTLASTVINSHVKDLTSDDRINVIVVDDTFYGRLRSKCVEMLSFVRDHTDNKCKKGFRLLTLAWSDGNTLIPFNFCLLTSGKVEKHLCKMRDDIHKNTNGYKRRMQAMQKAPDLMIAMLRQAVEQHIPAKHVLFDSWFSYPAILMDIAKLKLHSIGRLKDTPNIKYSFNGKKMTLKEIYNSQKKRRGRSKYLLSVVVSIHNKEEETMDARIVFVRDRNNRKKWIAIISTDLALSEEQIIQTYGKRWDIEVFYKMCKTYLNLGREFQGLSYDMMTAHTAVVLSRYIMLAIENRNNMDNRTIGELFYLCYDELQDIKFDEVIQLILEILSECLMEYFMIDDKRVNGFLRIFISRLPEYLKLRLPKSKVA